MGARRRVGQRQRRRAAVVPGAEAVDVSQVASKTEAALLAVDVAVPDQATEAVHMREWWRRCWRAVALFAIGAACLLLCMWAVAREFVTGDAAAVCLCICMQTCQHTCEKLTSRIPKTSNNRHTIEYTYIFRDKDTCVLIV